jgi:alpha,alpha-trehalase
MVASDYARTGQIKEKYDVVARTSDVHIEDGYADNVIGFGWTNGVFAALLGELTQNQRAAVLDGK